MNISDYESTNIDISPQDNFIGEYEAESDKVNNFAVLELHFPIEKKEVEQDQKQALSSGAKKATNRRKVSHQEKLAPKLHITNDSGKTFSNHRSH